MWGDGTADWERGEGHGLSPRQTAMAEAQELAGAVELNRRLRAMLEMEDSCEAEHVEAPGVGREAKAPPGGPPAPLRLPPIGRGKGAQQRPQEDRPPRARPPRPAAKEGPRAARGADRESHDRVKKRIERRSQSAGVRAHATGGGGARSSGYGMTDSRTMDMWAQKKRRAQRKALEEGPVLQQPEWNFR